MHTHSRTSVCLLNNCIIYSSGNAVPKRVENCAPKKMADDADATPHPRRRLGLRLRKGAYSTPGVRRLLTQPTTTPLTEAGSAQTAAIVPDQTPRTNPQQLKAKANTTNCRRIGLSRLRKDLSKKRLEFADTEVVAKTEETESPRKSEWRERQIAELEADIKTWQNGFVAAMEDLQALTEPRVSMETLLRQLKVPLEMLRYLEED